MNFGPILIGITAGVARGIRGAAKHAKTDGFDAMRFGVSVLVAAVMGAASGFLMDFLGIDPVTAEGLLVPIASSWLGTDVIDDIFLK